MTIKTKKQWDELEASFKELDDKILEISKRYKLTLRKNYHNWPSRSFGWVTDDGVNRKIELSLEGNLKTFKLFGYAWYDDSRGQRFIKILEIENEIHSPLDLVLNKISYYIGLVENLKKEALELAEI